MGNAISANYKNDMKIINEIDSPSGTLFDDY